MALAASLPRLSRGCHANMIHNATSGLDAHAAAVSDIDTAVAGLTQAGGTFMSTGGVPFDLPAGNRTLKVGIVRDPDGLFVVLIQGPPAPP